MEEEEGEIGSPTPLRLLLLLMALFRRIVLLFVTPAKRRTRGAEGGRGPRGRGHRATKWSGDCSRWIGRSSDFKHLRA